MRKLLLLNALQIMFCTSVLADQAPGQVTLPLETYASLISQTQRPPREAPSGYSIGAASADVRIERNGERMRAEINARINVRVLESEWALVPLLPSGAAIRSATLNGSPLQLVASPKGLSWATRDEGTYDIQISYSADVQGDAHQASLALPLPLAPSVNIDARIPGTGLKVSLTPSNGAEITEEGGSTRIRAATPQSQAVVLSWNDAHAGGIAVSRALVKGRAGEDAISFTVELEVESFGDGASRVQLLPTGTTLMEVTVDGKNAPILTSQGYYGTEVRGKGAHKVALSFEAKIEKHGGPSGVKLPLIKVPVTRMELSLPGRKDVKIEPASNIQEDRSEKSTAARAFIPMSDWASLSWTEAVPGEEQEEARLIANIYHTAFAEERTLFVRAAADYEISRGSITTLHFAVPDGIDISKVTADGVNITDWRVSKAAGKPSDLGIFFDREVRGSLRLTIEYDRPFPDAPGAEVEVPLLKAQSVHRERGMLALLAGKELSLKPAKEGGLTKVGENQLPAFLRDQISMTIAHTYKYLNGEAQLSVQAAPPERREGKYDATIDTLFSLADVTLRGSAGVEVNVKSGAVEELEIVLPERVNVLNLTAPSLRTFKANKADGAQVVNVQFTQEMEGQFRMELLYEFILDDKQPQLRVPTASLRGAEVEQGRIAVEALSAVEVEAATATSLSSLDPSELPQQLVLKTTNPILLAYKYARVEPPYQLDLKITRHREIEVQSAVIERAAYQTLYTRDGIMVTSAQFFVKNSRKQFLRVRLPEGSTIWAAEVNGRAEKPALAEAKGGAPEVLIKVINSESGFPVNLVYETKVPALSTFGILEGALPHPDMVVTSTHWDVFLPVDVSFGRIRTNMNAGYHPVWVAGGVIRDTMARMEKAAASAPQAASLLSAVPHAGIRISLDKLYASESDEAPYFSVVYTEGAGDYLSWILIAAAGLAIPLGAALSLRGKQRQGAGVTAGGAAFLALVCGWFGFSLSPAISALVLVTVLGMARKIWESRAAIRTKVAGLRRKKPTPETPAPSLPG